MELMKQTGFNPEQVEIIKKTVAKNTTDIELAYFLNICKSVDLNPFNKEIWCYKDYKGNLITFAGRDGLLSHAQKQPQFNGIRSCEVCANDHFLMDIANNKIEHNFGVSNRGAILGAYAIVFRKNGEPTIEYATFQTYYKEKGFSAWKTHPSEMIKKVAEAHALKKAFGLSGVQVEYDFQENKGIVEPIPTDKAKEIDKEIDKKLTIEKYKTDLENAITKDEANAIYLTIPADIKGSYEIKSTINKLKKELNND